jgi:drug/metabolite transporter (DMT)-like permease
VSTTALKRCAIGALLAVMVAWGSTYVITKSALEEIPPLLLAFLRFTIASAILLVLAQARGGPRRLPTPVPWASLALMGLTGITIFYLGFNLGLIYTSAADGALIQGAIPAATVGLSAALLGERLTRARAFGVALSVVGVGLILLAAGGPSTGSNRLLGDLLMLTTVAAWAVYTVLGRRLREAELLAVTAYSTAFGTLLLLPGAAYDLAVGPARSISAVSWGSWLAVLYLGIVCSALCYLFWNWSLQHLDASQAGNFINVIPVVGVASSAVVLGESIAAGQLLGGALVLVGVWLVIR